MGMVDEFMRQESVQHDLDGRVRRRRIDQIGALDGDQLIVGDGFARAQPAQRPKPHRRQAFGFDRRHVGAGGLDPQHLDRLAKEVDDAGLQRRIAAAMQHQLGIAAEQPGCVEAQRQIALDAGFGAARNHRFGVRLDPPALLARSEPPYGNRCQPRVHYPPAKRRDHQPLRRGRSASSLSPTSVTTGSGVGVEGGSGAAGAAGWETSLLPVIGAGSRTVERRRGGAEVRGFRAPQVRRVAARRRGRRRPPGDPVQSQAAQPALRRSSSRTPARAFHDRTPPAFPPLAFLPIAPAAAAAASAPPPLAVALRFASINDDGFAHLFGDIVGGHVFDRLVAGLAVRLRRYSS